MQRLGLVVAAAWAGFTTAALADTLQVPTEYATVQHAIDAAAKSGDIILIQPGVYVANLVVDGKSIEFVGAGADVDTTLDGGGGASAILVLNAPGDVTFTNLTIQNAECGVLASQAAIVMNGCRLRSNQRGLGCGSATLSSTVVEDNGGFGDGPGVLANTVTLVSCTVRNNWTAAGTQCASAGAGAIGADSITAIDTLFENNESSGSPCAGAGSGHGGAINADQGNFDRCRFIANTASGGSPTGGAVDIGEASFTQCLFAGNSAAGGWAGAGGGVHLDSGTFTNCTFDGNVAGAIWFGGHIVLQNCIIGPEGICPGGPEETGTADVSHSILPDEWPGEGNLVGDPSLQCWPATYELRPNSRCIDAGTSEPIRHQMTDLDGSPRFLVGRCENQPSGRRIDMGCFEFVPSTIPTADLSGDCTVDAIDLGLLLAAWGTIDGPTDLDLEPLVDSTDLGVLLAQWSDGPGLPCDSFGQILEAVMNASPTPTGNYGLSVARLGDLDGDGLVEAAVGSSSAVSIVSVDSTGSTSERGLIEPSDLGFPADASGLGEVVLGPGDVDGDSIADLVVMIESVSVLAFLNADATVRESRQLVAGGFVRAVGAIGDVDGDDTPDLAMVTNAFGPEGLYMVYLDPDGAVGSTSFVETPPFFFIQATSSIAALGDLNGDGHHDLALGMPGAAACLGHMTPGGEAYVLLLDGDGGTLATQEIGRPGGGVAWEYFGLSIDTNDFDGDGTPDLVVGAPTASAEGSVWIILLHPDGSTKASRQVVPDDVGESATFGFGVATLGDLDGDGLSELAIGARSDSQMWTLFVEHCQPDAD